MVINTEDNDCEGGKCNKESGQQPKHEHLAGTFCLDWHCG